LLSSTTIMMRATSFVVLSAGVASGSSLQDKPEVMPWEDWKQAFGWQANDVAEEAKRKGIYEQNVAFIRAENARGNSYRLGVNKFAHLTEEEFVAGFTGQKPADEDVPHMGTIPTLSSVAESLDWRTQGVVNPVKDQGQCGSCWAFSAAGTVESSYAITNGKLYSLAEQQLVDCSTEGGSEGCNGGWEDKALTHYATHGACTESGYPYTATDGTCKESSCTTAFGPGAVTGTTCTELSADGLVSGINMAPVSVAVRVDNTFQMYRSGIVDARCHASTNHAVIAVGYDADSFTIRNSWGADWGEEGYIRMARNTVSNSGGPFCLWQYCPALPTMATETTV
jgi:C1A family cysteine protease